MVFILFFFIISVPFLFFRFDKKLFLAIWCLILLREYIAIFNVYFFHLPGSLGDAIAFHQVAENISIDRDYEFTFGYKMYQNLLGFFYEVFGASHIIGHQLSILFFVFSCIFIIKIIRTLELQVYSLPILLAFGLIPSFMLNGTYTLRESYEVLFFIIAVYNLLQINRPNKKFSNILGVIFAATAIAIIHRSLLIYSIFLISLLFLINLKEVIFFLYKSFIKYRILVFLVFLIGSIFLFVLFDINHILAQNDFIQSIQRHRSLTFKSRAEYGVNINSSNLFQLTISFFWVYFNYLIQPLIWKIGSLMDIVASGESLFRILLIFCTYKQWVATPSIRRGDFALMLLFFFSISFFWSIGTTNYGTGSRHHAMDWWILCITGMPYLVNYLSSKKNLFQDRLK